LSLRWFAVDNAFGSFAPMLNAGFWMHMKLVGSEDWPPRTAGIESPWIFFLPVIHILSEIFLMVFTSGLISIGHKAKRRVIAKIVQVCLGFFVKKLIHRKSAANLRRLVCPG